MDSFHVGRQVHHLLAALRAHLDVEMSVVSLLPVEPQVSGVDKVMATVFTVQTFHGVRASFQKKFSVHLSEMSLEIELLANLFATEVTDTHTGRSQRFLDDGHDVAVLLHSVPPQVFNNLLAPNTFSACCSFWMFATAMFFKGFFIEENLRTQSASKGFKAAHMILYHVFL